MNRILAVSPHLDDAMFSAGGTLARHAADGDDVAVLTCFTGNVAQPTGFALACQLDKGLSPDVDYMAMRRAEDIEACRAIGARSIHLSFLEAPHRGYGTPAALFSGRRKDDRITEALSGAIGAEIDRFGPTRIYGPYGVGRHVDHLVVRAALLRVSGQIAVTLWEDFPYAMKEDRSPTDIIRSALDPDSAARKLTGVLSYASQLGYQFGSRKDAEAALAGWTFEGFTAAEVFPTRRLSER